MDILKKLFGTNTEPQIDKQSQIRTVRQSAKNTVVNKGKVLIGVGCSHTQGCAFTKNEINVEQHELASEALKEKYKTDKVSSEFLTSLSWVGKLGVMMKADKVYNFGFGGWGIESCIRVLRSYAFKQTSLKNHTIVIQIPSPTRKEIAYAGNPEQPTKVDTVGNITKFESEAPYKEAFLEHYIDFENIEGHMIYDLYYLQEYLEAKGAIVRFFDAPFSDWGIQTTNQSESFKRAYDEWWGKSYHKFETELPELPEVFNKLNIIDLTDFVNNNSKGDQEGTLHHEGLVVDDYHYSERGNSRLAKILYSRFNEKASTRIYATLPKSWEIIKNKKFI